MESFSKFLEINKVNESVEIDTLKGIADKLKREYGFESSLNKSTLGGGEPTYFLKVFGPKDTWTNGISMNSPFYAFFRIDDGVLEMMTHSYQVRNAKAKMRKTKFKNDAELEKKLMGYFKKNKSKIEGILGESVILEETLDEADRSLKKGDVVKIHKTARQDVVGQGKNRMRIGGKMGRLPAETEIMRIKKITKTKEGRKAHMVKPDGSSGGGYAIMLDKLPDFMTVEKITMNESNIIDKMRDMVNKKTKDRILILGGKPIKVSLKDASNLITLYDNQSSSVKKDLEKEISTRDGLKSVIDDLYEENSLDEGLPAHLQRHFNKDGSKVNGKWVGTGKNRKWVPTGNKIRKAKDVTPKGYGPNESKDSYQINHKTFSSAVQHAKQQVEKRGYEIDDDEWDRKVAMGPRKPGRGKTNTYTIDLMKNGKETRRKLQMQVYYDEGRYELNMYIS